MLLGRRPSQTALQTAVLYQLIYKEPYREQANLLSSSSPVKGMNVLCLPSFVFRIGSTRANQ